LKAGDAIDLVLARSEHQYRHIALLAENAADREAIQSWQHHIEDQQVGPLAAGEFERLNTVAGGEHTVALAFEVVAQCLGKGRIVFDEQDVWHRCYIVPCNLRWRQYAPARIIR